MKNVHRLNAPHSSEYALFIDRGEQVEFRHFQYYTGPLVEQRTVCKDKARAKYRAMVANGWMVVD